MLRVRFERSSPDRLETLHPGYFALVMATGIVAIAADIHAVPLIPTVLFWMNAAFLAALMTATVVRIIRYPGAFAADIRSHSRGVGFFTTVAGLGVFGSQLVLQMGNLSLATVLWQSAGILWIVVMYGVLAVLTVTPDKPSLTDGLNGSWLVSVVATQSIAILTVLVLHPDMEPGIQPMFMFLALILWLGGSALYIWLMTLIFFRYTFLRMSPEDLTPPYWINMGAMAISTLAGATLLQHAALSPIVAGLKPFVEGVTLFFWAVASWWIPMLLVLGVWRYVIRGVPFAYDPLYWGGVFPLGMYSVCTFRLAQVVDAPFLMPLSYAFMIVAIVAWVATFAGLVDTGLSRRVTKPSRG